MKKMTFPPLQRVDGRVGMVVGAGQGGSSNGKRKEKRRERKTLTESRTTRIFERTLKALAQVL
jgi:hypothetical protein